MEPVKPNGSLISLHYPIFQGGSYMNNQNNISTIEHQKFLLPAMVDSESDFTPEEIAEDMDGLQMKFQRVKIPSGGMLQFELPSDDPENPDYAKNLEGVILYNHASCAYWPAGKEYDENTNPLCSSVDGKQGIGDPGGVCATCALNRFGTAHEGNGKACKNMRVLYLLRSNEYMPLQINLPPTSISPFRDFLNQSFVLRRRATYGSVVQLALKRANNGGNDYSIATFRRLYDFTGEDLAQVRSYADGFKAQLKAMLQQQVTTRNEQIDEGCDYDTNTLPTDANNRFVIAATIDGEREALPA